MISIAKKIAFLFSVLLGLILFIFVLFQAMPNAEEMLTSQRADAKTKAAIVAELGLDEPLGKQALYSYLTRGSIQTYNSSVIVCRIKNTHAVNKTAPITTGKSDCCNASIVTLPKPLH